MHTVRELDGGGPLEELQLLHLDSTSLLVAKSYSACIFISFFLQPDTSPPTLAVHNFCYGAQLGQHIAYPAACSPHTRHAA